jgi:hypothetical protein
MLAAHVRAKIDACECEGDRRWRVIGDTLEWESMPLTGARRRDGACSHDAIPAHGRAIPPFSRSNTHLASSNCPKSGAICLVDIGSIDRSWSEFDTQASGLSRPPFHREPATSDRVCLSSVSGLHHPPPCLGYPTIHN